MESNQIKEAYQISFKTAINFFVAVFLLDKKWLTFMVYLAVFLVL